MAASYGAASVNVPASSFCNVPPDLPSSKDGVPVKPAWLAACASAVTSFERAGSLRALVQPARFRPGTSQVPGLNLAGWTSARSDPALSNEVTADAQAANQAGFT